MSESPTRVAATCPACGDDSAKTFVERSGVYSMQRCHRCGLEFASPMTGAPPEWYDAQPRGVRWEFDEVLRRFPGGGGRLLDIGCGKGTFLHLARRRGYRVTGIDFNRESLALARRRYHLDDLHALTLAELPDAWRECFDVVTAFHVLEHVEAPARFLEDIRAVLRPGGVLIAAVPNPRRAFLRLGREAWDHPPHHLTRWNRASLDTLFERTGFRIREVLEEPITFAGFFRYPEAYSALLYVGEGFLLDSAKRVTPLSLREVSRADGVHIGRSRRLGVVDLAWLPKTIVKQCFRLVGLAYGVWLVWRMRGKPGLSLCVMATRPDGADYHYGADYH